MKTKKFVIASLLLFWAFVTAILLAGFTNIGKIQGNTITGDAVALSNNAILSPELLLTYREVVNHNSSSSCWMIIDKKVYDVTSYIKNHPAGEATILSGCGKDSSESYLKSGHSDYAKSLLSKYFIGNLGDLLNNSSSNMTNTINIETNSSNKSLPKNNKTYILSQDTDTQNTNLQTNTITKIILSLTVQEISEHNTQSNCWSYLYNKVYDLTNYISIHPGGQNQIINVCGKNATSLFESGPHRENSLTILNSYYIGNLYILQNNSQSLQNNQNNTIVQNITIQNTTTIINSTNLSNSSPLTNITNQSNGAIPINNTNSTSLNPVTNTTTPNNGIIPVNTSNSTASNPIANPTNITNPAIHSITKQEISKHSYSYNCWSYINSKVYDLTSYISRFPGGPGLILNICGKDGTSLFEEAKNTPRNLSFLDIYFIGNLNTSQQTTQTNNEEEEDD